MKRDRTFTTTLILLLCVMNLSCGIGRMIWPQRDIDTYERITPSAQKRLLVASRSSEFKDAVVSRIRAAFEQEPVYMKFIGLEGLKQEDGETYDAIVLINMCIAWGLDPEVDGFIKRHTDHSHMIVVTTSGDGKWKPDKHGRTYDAISSASEQANVGVIADEITTKIRQLFEQG